MAYYNTATGKIYDAEEGTLTYEHEVAHKDYEETPLGRRIRVGQELSLDFLISLVAIYCIYPNVYIKVGILVLLLSKIFHILFEEIHCWIIAKNKMRLKDVKGIKGR